jgi:hypothetical protein
MTDMILDQLRRLGGTLGHLQGRVREAVAGEVGKAVADATAEVIAAALGGRLALAGRFASTTSSRYGRPEWDDDEGDWRRGYRRPGDEVLDDEEDGDSGEVPGGRPQAAAALALALSAGRWWLARKGSPLAAAGVGLAAGAALLGGGPLARAALTALWAVDRLLSSTALLGDGARAIERV